MRKDGMIPFRVYRHLGGFVVQRVVGDDNFFNLLALVLLAQAMDGFLGNVVVVLEERLDRRHLFLVLCLTLCFIRLLLVQRRRSDRTGGGCFSAAAAKAPAIGGRECGGGCRSRMTRVLEQRRDGRTIAVAVRLEIGVVPPRRAR